MSFCLMTQPIEFKHEIRWNQLNEFILESIFVFKVLSDNLMTSSWLESKKYVDDDNKVWT